MNYLINLGFSEEMLANLDACVPDKLKLEIKDNERLITENINYLIKIGITNYQEVFFEFYDIFFLDVSTFKEIFDKYEPDDLIAKIAKNPHIVEIL